MIYGSNWPVSDQSATYATVHGIVRTYFQERGKAATEKFFLHNAVAAYKPAAPNRKSSHGSIQRHYTENMNPLAAQLLDAYDRKRQIPLISAGDPAFNLTDAYRLTGALIALRQARGERLVGRKIGFTNRAVWPAYGVNAPIWGAVWDTTLQMLPADAGTLSLDGLMHPRLEPEIVLGLHKSPASAALTDLVDAIEWVAHGFEIVQCHYAHWKFTAADGIAAFGLHARLIVGPRVAVREFDATSAADFSARLSGVTLELSCDDRPVASGKGANVLDGPVQSLGHLVRTLAEQPELPPLGAGEIITTGTLTDAQTLAAGQQWQTRIFGAPLAGLRLSVTAMLPLLARTE